MRAIQITRLDGPEAVELNDVPDVTSEDQVVIDVRAAGVAFPDLLQTRGLYQIKPDPPFVPGAEVAGVVASAPAGSHLKVGDRVAALSMMGGFAEKVVAQPDLTFRLPEEVSFEQGASYLFNYGTAHFALLQRGGMVAGETVLVHGAAGGVGTASIQVAKAFGAGRVVAVVSSEAKGDFAVKAGADEYVLADGFKDAVGRNVDIVVDPVGGDRFTDSLRTLRRQGRMLVIGFTAGDIPTVKVNRLLLNNVSLVGVGWGEFALSHPGYIGTQWEAMLPHLTSGALRPPIGTTYPLADAATALKALDDRAALGKVVLTV